ncbi:GTPase [Caldanaerobacter subterraneus subsp. yonseiensis KB-1]|uniref:GTPase n=1 Tax=Caldanaerobacter subterraneus subsp. yonseiensis KB-1 TaxID=1388761 RepID=U5CN01_CALSX|nr:dynamin family protein [Caldanaerobacter subterraneus]ERM91363.1 GTPase [Caldanaerobacter subterraneus subsp. yonseiensis KB-1]
MRGQYSLTKKNLDLILERIEEISKNADIKAINDTVLEVKNKFSNNIFYLVVLGQFKRGKSTFINYILGADILPTGVVPLTSVITKVQYSTSIWAKVIHNDGMEKDIDIDELDLYCTERNNPENIKGVKEIHIGYPFDFVAEDVVIVDTPGIGSVYKHNTDIAYNYIDKADAVIFLFSVDPPISEVEKEFLSEISKSVDKIFFVLNKIDYVTEKELKEIVTYNRNIIREITGNSDIFLYPISAKLALEGKLLKDEGRLKKSGVQMLENDLRNFLLGEKEKVLLERYTKNIKRIISMCKTFFESNIRLKLIPLEQLEANIKAFEKYIEEVERAKKEISLLLRSDMKKILQNFDEKSEEYKKLLSVRVSEKVNNYYYTIRNLGRVDQKRELEKYFERVVIEEFEKLKEYIEKEAEEQYSKALSNYLSRLNTLIENIKAVVDRLFGLNIEYFKHKTGITSESKFTYRIGYEVGALEIDPVYFTYLLPKKLAGKLILNRVLKRIEIDIDRNLGRIRYDLLRRIEKSSNEFEKDMNFKLQVIYDVLKELIDKALKDYKLDKESFEKEKSHYQMLLGEINELEERLSQIGEK